MLIPSIFLSFATACTPDVIDKGQPTSMTCEPGFILDGSACVPEDCGTGRWGNLPVDEDTIYVDGSEPEGGDGTEGSPYSMIQRGLNRAGALGGGLVAVAAGIYPETTSFTTDHDGVRLAGRCRELSILDASVGDEETPGIGIDAGESEIEVTGLTVWESSFVGLVVSSGEVIVADTTIKGSLSFGVVGEHPSFGGVTDLVMEGCLLDDNGVIGLYAADTSTQVLLRDTIIQNTRQDDNGTYGLGLTVYSGASLDMEGCSIERNTGVGLLVRHSGTRVGLVDTVVRDTQPDADGSYGVGIDVSDGVSLSAEGCLVEGNLLHGLYAGGSGTEVSLRNTIIRGTRPDRNGAAGRGIEVNTGAFLSADGCLIEDNTEAGLLVGETGSEVFLRNTTVKDTEDGWGVGVQSGGRLSAEGCTIDGNNGTGLYAVHAGSEVNLRNTTVRNTLPDALGHGLGIDIFDGVYLVAESCLIEGSVEVGLIARNPGTRVVLRDTTVRDTRPNADGNLGWGIGLQDGATLSAEGCLLEDNTEVGLYAGDPGTHVTLRNSTISRTRIGNDPASSVGNGLGIQQGATLSAFHVVVQSNEGPGLLVNDARIECSECLVQDNQFAGVAVLWGGQALISDSTIQGTRPHVNLLGGAGVYAWPWFGGAPEVILANTLIQDNPVAGVWLIGNGTYILTGNTVFGGMGESFGLGSRCGDAILALQGITAWNGSTGLLLQDNELRNASGSGVFLDDSSALMSGNAYSDNGMDLVVQNQSCDAIPTWYAEAPQRVLCPDYNYPTCFAEFFFVAQPADPVE